MHRHWYENAWRRIATWSLGSRPGAVMTRCDCLGAGLQLVEGDGGVPTPGAVGGVPAAVLSPREQQVAALLGDGCSNREIAEGPGDRTAYRGAPCEQHLEQVRHAIAQSGGRVASPAQPVQVHYRRSRSVS